MLTLINHLKSTVVLFSLLVLSITLSLNAQRTTQSDLSAIKKQKDIYNKASIDFKDDSIDEKLIIGILPNYPPHTFLDKNQNPTGFDVEVVSNILKKMGKQCEFIPTEWAKALVDLKVGEIDLLPITAYTDERKQYLNFTDSYHYYQAVLFVHSDNDSIHGKTDNGIVEALFGKKIIVGAGYAEINQYQRYDQIKLETTISSKLAFQKLAAGKVDAAPMTKYYGLYFIQKNQLPVKIAYYYKNKSFYATAVSKKLSPNFIKNYNSALKKMKSNGIIKKLKKKWFNPLLPTK